MKASTFIIKLVFLFLLLTAFKCDDQDSNSRSCDDYISKLEQMKAEIKDLGEASVCDKNFECRSIALGSKPCGGPWSYLVYSTSIDTLTLHNLVEAHNKLEREYNTACQQYSDCMMVKPPLRIECEDNKCIAIY
ncbi:hypothetical protein [Gelidibacter maritimus]|uniref:Uncharacterized protein n=1 Tax=Gelidibacter maritimus TaxID=2761487 RepID=A0A7W2R2R1_9FLAO|nr:hypothetical protein [Gelidibacter maritimus]MBA6151858.1 hypothetical protein [Gelidibacter maritimus]